MTKDEVTNCFRPLPGRNRSPNLRFRRAHAQRRLYPDAGERREGQEQPHQPPRHIVAGKAEAQRAHEAVDFLPLHGKGTAFQPIGNDTAVFGELPAQIRRVDSHLRRKSVPAVLQALENQRRFRQDDIGSPLPEARRRQEIDPRAFRRLPLRKNLIRQRFVIRF